MQNGGTFSMIMELYRAQDPATLQRKFEAFEEKLQQQQSEAQNAANENQKAQMQQMAQMEQAKQELEKYKIDLESNTKIEVALIQAESSERDGEPMEDNGDSEDKKIKIQEDSLAETIRKNRKAEELKQQEINIKRTQSNAKKQTSN